MSKFYITTAIAYVNAPPHVGHALEFIQCDMVARFHRLKGDDTYFLTGTDEHGVKIYETAKEKGMDTKEMVDLNASHFMALKDILWLSNDNFIRTTFDLHKRGATKIWNKMLEAGDIYKGVYKGNYCSGCESFIPEKDLDAEGNCPIHKRKPKILEEENYFFRLSKYSDAIKEAISSGKLKVIPDARKNEMLNIIGEEGLLDVSFSRPKSVLPWGITVPNDENQVMYVWCDALSNYITAIDYENESELFKKYWPCEAHLIGKDILRFHAGIWIGMLMSAGVAIPKAIYVHGFVTSEGQKMSKSLGNVVDPLAYVDKYGVDAVRYYLLREIPTTDDGDFSQKRFIDLYNSELANSLGNLFNRVLTMIERYLGGKIPEKTKAPEMAEFVEHLFKRYENAVNDFNLKDACESVVALTDYANKYIDDKKPWLLEKSDTEQLAEVMYNLVELLRFIAILMSPILPKTAMVMSESLGLSFEKLTFDSQWGKSEEGKVLTKPEGTLFPRIEE